MMTVAELIKQLQTMPQNAEVRYWDGDNGWCEPCPEYAEDYVENPYQHNPAKVRKWKGVCLNG